MGRGSVPIAVQPIRIVGAKMLLLIGTFGENDLVKWQLASMSEVRISTQLLGPVRPSQLVCRYGFTRSGCAAWKAGRSAHLASMATMRLKAVISTPQRRAL